MRLNIIISFIVFPFWFKPRHLDIRPSGRWNQLYLGRAQPFQIRATHRAVLYVPPCVLKHIQ
ncbi:hypothetical protein E0W45_11030 [Neisseria meningitidis]|nr:hypothetical protein A6J49_00300 [Neisseria meningitidis]MBG8625708.1 hypothetical protein [Neisseria meningitidis]MBG8631925.1 hypothetical protein [Neisseria meningitidis]MBG8636568.1 hypothetical protein [Neisseria meningitidis]MBG8645067.1 hypothetical protein [Neisseria meningitidis]